MSTNVPTNSERLSQLEKENDELRNSIMELKRFVKQTMGSYVTPEVANQILEQNDTIGIDGERRLVTMLFTDLRDSTALSEQMEATDYIRLLNHYFWCMIQIVNSWQGNILDFVGDALVVVFGAPKENPDAARDALYSAGGSVSVVYDWQVSWERIYYIVDAYAGGTGFYVSPFGGRESEARCLVNLASRIEGFSKGGQILASTQTMEAARANGDLILEREEGSMWVSPKGIASDVLVHDVIGVNRLHIPEWWT